MLAGAALAAAPAAARADEAPRYPRLPVIARDWTKVAPEPGVPDPVGREQQRQAEAGRRWHAVHEMVGANHLSRRAAASLAGRGLGAALVAGDGAKSASY
ncbi:MAG TPA: hypothetical protein PLQ13_12385, partial [Candidatus Krumholzibacteria bacterium]|nr:hypothetical protein [Candidatus Krumholzibacteria bacterium]